MKKIIAVFLFPFIVFLSTNLILAQSPTPTGNAYAVAYQDYINKTGIYQVAHGNYLTARANYLSSQSLDSQDKAMKATLAMLQARDQATISYLTAVKIKVQTTQGVSQIDENSLQAQLDNEIGWYSAHNTKLPSAGSLSDLVSDSDDAKAELNGPTLIVVYNAIVTLGIGNNTYIRGELNNEISTLRAKIDEIKANQDKDVSSIERSLIDVQNKIDRSQSKDNDAKSLINGVKPTDTQKDNNFQDAQSDISNSNSYLKEANQGLLQIITQIKSAN